MPRAGDCRQRDDLGPAQGGPAVGSLSGTEQQMAFQAYAPEGGQQLRVEVNGQELEPLDMAPGWADYVITLPPSRCTPG